MRYRHAVRSLVLALLLTPVVPTVAHHGADTFATGKQITLKGTVSEWIWANPHCFLRFDAKDDTGTVRNWVAETQNPVSMTARGLSRSMVKAGDQVTVTVEPAKNGEPVARLLSIMLPDGRTLVAANPLPATPAPAP
jgi:hypothetical protein